MGGYGDVKLLREDGKRLDGRAIDEMRPVTIEAGVLPAADGSAMVTHGLNVAVAAVYGPMEAHLERFSDKIVLLSTYDTTWHRSQPVTEFDLDSTDGAVKSRRSLLSLGIGCPRRTLPTLKDSS